MPICRGNWISRASHLLTPRGWEGLATALFLFMLVAAGYVREASGGSVDPNSSRDAERKIDKVYYADGALFSETNLFSDKYNGFYKTYYKNGQLAAEIRYKDGWQIYDKAFAEAGQPVFRNGPFQTYYASGQVASIGEYKNDMKNGTETFYYYDGRTVVDIWHYLNGRQVGQHIRNDAAGNFVYADDWGYPTYYVESLQVVIYGLTGLIFMLAGALLFQKNY